jgi:hypothetical protein
MGLFIVADYTLNGINFYRVLIIKVKELGKIVKGNILKTALRNAR